MSFITTILEFITAKISNSSLSKRISCFCFIDNNFERIIPMSQSIACDTVLLKSSAKS